MSTFTHPDDLAARWYALRALRHWRLIPDNFTLRGSGVNASVGRLEYRWEYEIDLERCLTSAAALDWIVQVSQKGFCSNEALGELVRALDLVLDLQGTLCSFSMARPCDHGKRLTRAWVRTRCCELAEPEVAS